jgi:hypothetical protein
MTKPLISYRRIDQLKAIAFDRGFSNEDAKQFGKLSKTATWFALLEAYGIPSQGVDSILDSVLDKQSDSVLDKQLDSILDKQSDSVLDKQLDSVDTRGWTNDGSFPVCDFTRPNSSFLDWVDFGQLVALVLASAGLFVLAMSMWRQINPLNLFPPVKVNIQIGTKL